MHLCDGLRRQGLWEAIRSYPHDITIFIKRGIELFHSFCQVKINEKVAKGKTVRRHSMKLSHAVWSHPRRAGHGGEV